MDLINVYLIALCGAVAVRLRLVYMYVFGRAICLPILPTICVTFLRVDFALEHSMIQACKLAAVVGFFCVRGHQCNNFRS